MLLFPEAKRKVRAGKNRVPLMPRPSKWQKTVARLRYELGLRYDPEEGESLTSISESLRISLSTLKRWKKLEGWEILYPAFTDQYVGVQKLKELSEAHRAIARTWYEAGEDLDEIAEDLESSPAALRRAARREGWTRAPVELLDEAA
jgi:uncharacterized protein YjcR